MLLPQNPKEDDQQPDGREGDREQPAVFEDLPGKVAQIQARADGTEYHEDSPDEDHTHTDHGQVHTEVEELRELAVGVLPGHTAPEGHHTEEIKPEGIINPALGSDVHPECGKDHQQTEAAVMMFSSTASSRFFLVIFIVRGTFLVGGSASA